MEATTRDDRLLLDFFSTEKTNSIAQQDKWWFADAIVLIAVEFAFGCAVL
jgi:hypothetical protein